MNKILLLSELQRAQRYASREVTLASVHRSWGTTTDIESTWLRGRGISWDSMLEPEPIGAANVRFLDTATFDVDPEGERALTFRAIAGGEVIDLVAYAPRSGRIGSWKGIAWCLGDADEVHNPAHRFMGGGLQVHRTPIEWLSAARAGIVIVQPKLCGIYLNGSRLAVADREFEWRLRGWLVPPTPQVEIIIQRNLAA
jgi:hypothetical protein